jgi:hypothetical protein
MPYIAKKDRNLINCFLNEAINIILSQEDKSKKSEMVGFWTYYLVNSSLSKKTQIKSSSLAEQADNVLNQILEPLGSNPTEDQIFSFAGNLNYSISYVAWGVLGDHKGAQKASYGMRCYTAQQIRSVLESIAPECEKINMILRGVLNDVLDELYRRKTSVYEDKKILENGDLEY